MRVLIIDDSEDFRLLAAQYLSIEWPTVEIDEYDPIERGAPGVDFEWQRYDVLLLDYQLGAADGLAWLRTYRRAPGFPPVVFLTGSGSEEVAVQALKLGVDDYLRKHDLSKAQLIAAVNTALEERFPHMQNFHGADPLVRTVPIETGRALAGEFQINEKGLDHSIRINGYQLLRKLGEGGMSSVYLTRRESDGAEVALKILDGHLSRDPAELKRFIREFDIIAKLDTPHVVRIFDQGFSDKHIYIAMEFFPNGDSTRLMRKPLDPHIAVCLIAAVGRALAAIHSAGIVHRDLKPQNIMLRADGSLALVDFGVSYDTSLTLTMASALEGTPIYMSPEQCEGKPVDGRSDLYSLGCMLHELLTGQRAYEANSLAELIFKHLTAPIPRLPDGMAPCQPLLNRLMAKSADERFNSALELLEYVERRWQMPVPDAIPWRYALAMN